MRLTLGIPVLLTLIGCTESINGPPTPPSLAANPAQTSSGNVIGSIDGITNNSLTGWTCVQGSATSIKVDFYLNGPVGTGTPAGSVIANQSSEPSIATNCQSTGSAYRFSVDLTVAEQSFPGQTIYAYGDAGAAITGLLTNSGSFTVPTSTPTSGSSSGNVIGNIDGISNNHLTGWACVQGSATSIKVDFYLNGPVGTGTPAGFVIANQTSEPSIATACQSTGSAYRFSVDLTAAEQSYPGQTIYAYGDAGEAKTGLLTNSGSFTVPQLAGTN